MILRSFFSTFYESCKVYGLEKEAVTERQLRVLKGKRSSDELKIQADQIKQILMTICFILEDMHEQHVNWRMQVAIMK